MDQLGHAVDITAAGLLDKELVANARAIANI